MTAVLEELVDVATLLAMLEAALRWPVELLEDVRASARSLAEWHAWLVSFLGFGGAA